MVVSAVITELRLLLRHRVILSAAVLTGVWLIVLLLADASSRPEVARWVITLDLAALGFFFAPAMAVIERGNGIPQALRLTRLQPWETLAIRIGALAAVGGVSAGALVVVAGSARPGIVIAGAAGSGILFSLLALALLGRSGSFTTFVGRVPLVAVVLIVPALLDALGVLTTDAVLFSPVATSFRLMGGQVAGLGLAWWLICLVGLWLLVLPTVSSGAAVSVAAPTVRSRSTRRSLHRGPADSVAAILGLDRRVLSSDGVLLLTLGGLPLLFGLAWWLLNPGRGWVAERGVNTVGYEPIVWALVFVVHTAVIVGSVVGLMVLEDRDAGLLPALAVTRPGLVTVVRARAGVGAAIAGGLVVTGLLAVGVGDKLGVAGVLAVAIAAGAVAVLQGLVLATFAGDRVQGIGVMKLTGIPMYAPLAMWFLGDGPATVFLVLPSAWPVRAMWASSLSATVAWSFGGLVICLGLAHLLMGRLQRSVAI